MINRDYTAKSTVLSADFITMINNHPESFECQFFQAQLSDPEVVAPDSISDVAGSIEELDRKILYLDPVPSRAIIVPDESLSLLSFESGEDSDIRSNMDPIVVLIRESTVPMQSIITWIEKTGQGQDDIKTVSYYVMESKPFGKAPVAGMKHYCIPLLSSGEES